MDRPNTDLCLNTFQTAGGEWVDPTTKSGKIEDSSSLDLLEDRFQASLDSLSKTVAAEKIYILQISDANKEQLPSQPNENGLRQRGQWSTSLRRRPYDGGYLPVADVARAALKSGFRGWFSVEIFDGGPTGWIRSRKLGRIMRRRRCGLMSIF